MAAIGRLLRAMGSAASLACASGAGQSQPVVGTPPPARDPLGEERAARDAEVSLEAAHFRSAQRKDTEADWDAFLAKHPLGAHAPEARARRTRLWFAAAKQANTIAAYEAFLAKTGGEFSLEARARIEQLELGQARAARTPEELETILGRVSSAMVQSEIQGILRVAVGKSLLKKYAVDTKPGPISPSYVGIWVLLRRRGSDLIEYLAITTNTIIWQRGPPSDSEVVVVTRGGYQVAGANLRFSHPASARGTPRNTTLAMEGSRIKLVVLGADELVFRRVIESATTGSDDSCECDAFDLACGVRCLGRVIRGRVEH
jgi:hypothetical protein